VILHDESIIADRHVQGAVSVGKCEYSHALITDSSVVASVFPQARSLDTKQVKTIASILMVGSSASNVVDAMREDQGKTIKPKDVYNINQRIVKTSYLGKSKDDQLMLQIDEMKKGWFCHRNQRVR
jgi:beta-lactamase class D